MENRLCLNNVPTFDIEGLTIKEYRTKEKPNELKPDIRINIWGDILGEVLENKVKTNEAWVFLEDKKQVEELKNFIKNTDWEYKVNRGIRCGTPSLKLWRLKKIILEEFYLLETVDK